MAEIKWIKLDTSLFDNRKIKQIRTLPEGDSLVVIWLQLMCLAGTVNDLGKIYFTDEIPYTDQMMASAFGEPLTTVQLALTTFQKFGMIDIIDDIIYINNWEKYQAIEGMEKVREQARFRMQKSRERKKLLDNATSYATSYATVTQRHALDIDKDKELDLEKDYLLENQQEKEKEKKLSVKELIFEHTFGTFEEEFGRPLSQKESEQLAELLTTYGADKCINALREASIQRIYKMTYIEKILVKGKEEQ